MALRPPRLAPALLLGLAACRPSASQPVDPVVLTLGDSAVHRSEFERSLAEVELPDAPADGAEVRRALFDAFVDEQLLMMEARERGLVAADADSEAASRAARQLASEIAARQPPIDEAAMRAYYDEHIVSFQTSELVSLSQILVATLNEARDVYRRLNRDPKRFEMLARKLSIGPEASEGGRMGTFARGELPTALERAAFSLSPGGRSPIVETPLGFHVLRLDERLPARERPFEECRDEILARLQQDHADDAVRDFVRSLRARAQVNYEVVTNRPLDRS